MMRYRSIDLIGSQRRPRLTLRGATILVLLLLTIGPAVSFGIGIPLDLLTGIANHVSGQSLAPSYSLAVSLWMLVSNLLVWMVIGLPVYGWWADTHLWHVAGWVACCVILVASSRRGIHVRDAALIAASAVLAFPLLVDTDSPHLTWAYPDAIFMAVAAACGAALCTIIVRGRSRAGMRKRMRWGWLA